jgi:hypothetical protein
MSYASLISTLPTTLVGGATMMPAQSCCWPDPESQLSKYRVTGAPQLVGGCHGPDVRVSDNTDEALTIASGKPDPKCLICVPCVTACQSGSKACTLDNCGFAAKVPSPLFSTIGNKFGVPGEFFTLRLYTSVSVSAGRWRAGLISMDSEFLVTVTGRLNLHAKIVGRVAHKRSTTWPPSEAACWLLFFEPRCGRKQQST